MSFRRWLHRRPGSRRTAALWPTLGVLETRCVPASYAVTDLGTLGGYASNATDLNQAGQVVGASDTADGFYRAFVWDNGTMTDLGTLGGIHSWAEGINDQGQVVGSAYLPGDASIHGFLVTPQGGAWFQDSDLDGRNDFMIDLGALNGSDSSGASDINNAGQVSGYSIGPDGLNHAFLWDATNGMADLGTPSGFSHSWAHAINAVGQVTGVAQYYDELTGWHSSTFLWDAAAGMIDLGASPGNTDSTATGINDAGQVVGIDWHAAAPTNLAYVWTPDSPNGRTGSFTTPGTLPGGIDSTATAINNAGQVVGSSAVDTGWDYYPRAFLWDAAGGMVDLQGRLLPGHDATLEGAQAINGGGSIAANGYNTWVEYRAYLLTPTRAISIADAPAVTEGNAGPVVATFTVTLSEASEETVTVDYVTGNGTAAAGADYQAATGTVTFAPGETSQTITVQVAGDRLPEPNETFVVTLSGPTGASVADGHGVGTIRDDEPRISVSDVTRAEGRKNQTTLFTFTVSLSAAYVQAVTVSFRTVNGTAKSGEDYVARSGTLTFAPGETAKDVTVEVKGDNKREANETFSLELFGVSVNALLLDPVGLGRILNDD